MSKPAAIEGAFADLKVIKTRSVVQIVVEVPIEHADAALEALGGVPRPGAERRVAVARLVDVPKAAPSPMKSLQGKEAYANKGDMQQAVARAALLCKGHAFQRWLGVEHEDDARARMCSLLDVASRSLIGTNHDAYRAFLNLEGQYRAHMQTSSYPSHWTGAA